MKSTSVFLLRENLSSYLDEIVKTEVPVVVYRFNKPVAILMPAKESLLKTEFKKFYGFLKGKEKGLEYEYRVRRNDKEKKYIENLIKRKT